MLLQILLGQVYGVFIDIDGEDHEADEVDQK
jgi:hypothetical protein